MSKMVIYDDLKLLILAHHFRYHNQCHDCRNYSGCVRMSDLNIIFRAQWPSFLLQTTCLL